MKTGRSYLERENEGVRIVGVMWLDGRVTGRGEEISLGRRLEVRLWNLEGLRVRS